MDAYKGRMRLLIQSWIKWTTYTVPAPFSPMIKTVEADLTTVRINLFSEAMGAQSLMIRSMMDQLTCSWRSSSL